MHLHVYILYPYVSTYLCLSLYLYLYLNLNLYLHLYIYIFFFISKSKSLPIKTLIFIYIYLNIYNIYVNVNVYVHVFVYVNVNVFFCMVPNPAINCCFQKEWCRKFTIRIDAKTSPKNAFTMNIACFVVRRDHTKFRAKGSAKWLLGVFVICVFLWSVEKRWRLGNPCVPEILFCVDCFNIERRFTLVSAWSGCYSSLVVGNRFI